MARATLTERVEAIEQTLTTLAPLPTRVEAIACELKEFRAEVRVEFAAVRSELRAEIRASHDSLAAASRREPNEGNDSLTDALRREMKEGNDALKQAIEQSNTDTRYYMWVLYEDLAQRIATIGEGRP